MYSVWLSDDEQRVWRDYLAMTNRLEAEMNRQLQRDCGLSLADYDVLVAVDEQPGCRINALGDRLGWEQSRLSHQLRRMADRGLVERTGAKDDRRAATVALTAQGRRALKAAAPGHAALVRETVFAGVTPTDLKAVGRWTRKVVEALTSPTRRT